GTGGAPGAPTIGWPAGPITGAGMALGSGPALVALRAIMSRRNTFSLLSSSPQMVMAAEVDGLSHQPAVRPPPPASNLWREAARLDALGDGDLALAREKLHRPHFAQIHAHRIIRALGRLLGLGLGRDLLLDLDQLAALALGLLVGLLARLFALFARLLGLDHV